MNYILFDVLRKKLGFQNNIFLFKMSRQKTAELFSQELLAGWSMGANVCPKYEGVFRDHPVFPLQFK